MCSHAGELDLNSPQPVHIGEVPRTNWHEQPEGLARTRVRWLTPSSEPFSAPAASATASTSPTKRALDDDGNRVEREVALGEVLDGLLCGSASQVWLKKLLCTPTGTWRSRSSAAAGVSV